MAEFAVILPAAGKSTRMTGFQKKKPFVDLKGRPVWLRTAELFMNRADVSQTIVVISPDDLDWFRETYKANLAFSDITLVAGGATRADSVRNGLAAIRGQPDFVAVHDAARPLMTAQWIDQIFTAAEKLNAVIPGVRITSTVKKIDDAGKIVQTVDRSHLVQAQTPQVFQRDLLVRAYAQNRRASDATDEASLVGDRRLADEHQNHHR